MRVMQRPESIGTTSAALARAFQITEPQAEAIVHTVMPEIAWHLQRNMLSRGGLADLVDALASGHHTRYAGGGAIGDDAAVADGEAILGHLLGSKERSRALAARAARRSGVGADRVQSMLPGLAATAMGDLAVRASCGLDEITALIPPLGAQARGSPYADLAGILRRSCGVGPYSSGRLRQMVRWVIGRAGGFRTHGVARWYVGTLVGRPAARAAHRLIRRVGR